MPNCDLATGQPWWSGANFHKPICTIVQIGGILEVVERRTRYGHQVPTIY